MPIIKVNLNISDKELEFLNWVIKSDKTTCKTIDEFISAVIDEEDVIYNLADSYGFRTKKEQIQDKIDLQNKIKAKKEELSMLESELIED